MAGDGGDSHRRLDGRFAEEVQAELGILAVPFEQRAMDRMGLARQSLCPHHASGLSRVYEHPRRDEELAR